MLPAPAPPSERIAYDAAEAGALVKLSAARMRELARKGEVPAVRVGGVWRFPCRLLDDWMAGRGVIASRSDSNASARAS